MFTMNASSSMPPALCPLPYLSFSLYRILLTLSHFHANLSSISKKKPQLCLSNNHLPITAIFLIPFSIKERKKHLFQSDWSLVLVLACTDTCGSKPSHVPSSACLAVSDLSPGTSIRYTQSPTLLHGSMGTNSISEMIISRKKVL